MKIACSNLIPHFGTIARISLKTKIVLILKYQMATLTTYYNNKIYNEEVTDKLPFVKGITRKLSDLTIKRLKKEKAAGVGGLSNEIYF